MKCICPMGGGQPCPPDCPNAMGVPAAEQRARRKEFCEAHAKLGYTQEQTAKLLGVSQGTVARDLADFYLSETAPLKSAKTASNPKGAGRPRGKKPINDTRVWSVHQ
jgi:hypothetical protein